MVKYVCLIVFALWSARSIAQEFEFNETCREAYSHILSLRLNKSSQLLSKEKQENPDNYLPYFLENYHDFFRAFIQEDQVLYEKLEVNKNDRLEKIQSGNENSPFYRYAQAEIHLHSAFAGLKLEEYLSAVWAIRKAYKLLEENRKLFPHFTPNNKSLGLLKAMVGTVPDKYKWGVNLLGMDGTIPEGMNLIALSVEQDNTKISAFREEALVIYTFATLYLQNDQEKAWELIEKNAVNTKDHLLNTFVAANVAMYTGHNDEAIQILKKKPVSAEYLKFPYLDFMLGVAKLRRLDENADIYLTRFLKDFKGRHNIKEAYQKLGWHALVNSDVKLYKSYMEKVKTEGFTFTDDDKQALKEAENNTPPEISLLKARLLYDGGYYESAINILRNKTVLDFSNTKDRVEFAYRQGRIYDSWGKKDMAIIHYKLTIDRGKDLSYYYAANSALKMGNIYEERKNFDKAEYYYKLCMSMKGHEYKSSLDQKAKAGLSRIKAQNNG